MSVTLTRNIKYINVVTTEITGQITMRFHSCHLTNQETRKELVIQKFTVWFTKCFVIWRQFWQVFICCKYCSYLQSALSDRTRPRMTLYYFSFLSLVRSNQVLFDDWPIMLISTPSKHESTIDIRLVFDNIWLGQNEKWLHSNHSRSREPTWFAVFTKDTLVVRQHYRILIDKYFSLSQCHKHTKHH